MLSILWKRQDNKKDAGTISKKPPNTAFRQQRLKSWQPILVPQNVLPFLILIACIFTPIGIGLMVSSNHVQDLTIDYSKCDQLANKKDFVDIPSKYVNYHFKEKLNVKPTWKLSYDNTNDINVCQLQFEIPNTIKKPVYVYYKLTNFYQNHRKYVQSFDRKQINGKAVNYEDLDTSCRPLRSINGKAIYPCGLIANSMFNDTFGQVFEGYDESTQDYQLTNKKISWAIDRKQFKKTTYNASDIVPPPNWMKKFPNGYTDDNIPNIHEWEEFQVWMRTAALPKFYKLALKNETTHLPKGRYVMKIGLNYPTSIFGGTKSFVLTTLGVTGTRNLSLSIMFLIVAGISAVFAIIFLVKITFQSRVLGDNASLTFENDEYEQYDSGFTNGSQSTRKTVDDLSPLREIL